MRNVIMWIVIVVVIAILGANMFMYQVRYDEVAILTRFNEAGPDAVKTEAGLKFRWFPPINRVTTYSNKIKLLEDRIEELQTDDDKSIVILTYVAWRIEDPLKFYNSLKTTEAAETQLRSRLADIRKVISTYRFNQLVNTDKSVLKLEEVEENMRLMLQNGSIDNAAAGNGILDQYGIKVEQVGIRKIVLPGSVTDKVFTAMIKTRERKAENAKREGEAQATTIRTKAQADRDVILAFAERRADAIRAQGDREASQHLAVFQENAESEEFAIFLRKIETLKETLAQKTTFVLSADSMLELFTPDPALNQSIDKQASSK